MLLYFQKNLPNNGIYNEVSSLINNEELQPSANIVISTCDAYDYLNNSTPNLEKMTVKYYETFAITSRFTGYISNISIGKFYDLLVTNGPNPTAILGGLNSTTRKQMSEVQRSKESSSENSNARFKRWLK